MSLKRVIENKVTMATYDNVKLQKKARNLYGAVKDVEKTLNSLTRNSARKT